MHNTVLLKGIVGSQAYGTATATSDIDYKGVYIQPINDILSFKYKEQYEVCKDEVYYEVKRFLQLLKSANPGMLELLFMPEDCIIEKSIHYNIILKEKDRFVTKKCLHSFGGYAIAQIKKAKGLDKKMNWDMQKVERRTPLYFCYIYEDGKTIPLEKFLSENHLKQENCGLVALDHFRDCYSLFYDYSVEFGAASNRDIPSMGFHGIAFDDSNGVRLSSVPKYATPLGIVYYNKDGYSIHCKDFNEYTVWLNNRNTQRFVDIEGHNQKIDGKNILHCRRLLDMAIEIATEGIIRVKRPNASELLNIRHGKVNLDAIIAKAEEDVANLDELFAKSSLPEDVDDEFINDLLLEIREKVYTGLNRFLPDYSMLQE